ncbi:MAG: ligase-associated DNA damage response exonuclease [Gammaproteobacteria bacterium]|nr:ligase-associated DNA damage response exonuclease [Gammaproteobacteria bacterium]
MVTKNSADRDPLVVVTREGLYCPKADAYIDPWRPVETALITHAHADHARPGSRQYHCLASGAGLLTERVRPDSLSTHDAHEPITMGALTVSWVPAGHVLGSAQIRLSDGEQVWVVTGDYKRTADPSCDPFEPIQCDVLITEATFALPIYRWPSMDQVMDDLCQWWDHALLKNRQPVLYCYALGKAQRIMAELALRTTREVCIHPTIAQLLPAYLDQGIPLCPWHVLTSGQKAPPGTLILAPPGAQGGRLITQFRALDEAMASGWMQIRGVRRRRALTQGFVLSDHADWDGLLQTIKDSGASRVLATHGETRVLTDYLNRMGVEAARLSTSFGQDEDTA